MEHIKSINPQKTYNEWQIMFGEHLVLVTLHHGSQLVLSQIIRNGDTKYHI
jgi:hypothetical protein